MTHEDVATADGSTGQQMFLQVIWRITSRQLCGPARQSSMPQAASLFRYANSQSGPAILPASETCAYRIAESSQPMGQWNRKSPSRRGSPSSLSTICIYWPFTDTAFSFDSPGVT